MNIADPIRILVVDDTVVYRKIVSDVIAGLPGAEVAGTAHNGKAALTKIRSLKPDLVTLDIEMPEMDSSIHRSGWARTALTQALSSAALKRPWLKAVLLPWVEHTLLPADLAVHKSKPTTLVPVKWAPLESVNTPA